MCIYQSHSSQEHTDIKISSILYSIKRGTKDIVDRQTFVIPEDLRNIIFQKDLSIEKRFKWKSCYKISR